MTGRVCPSQGGGILRTGITGSHFYSDETNVTMLCTSEMHLVLLESFIPV